MSKINTTEIAARAVELRQRKNGMGLFAQFQIPDLFEPETKTTTLAFMASRYAYVGSPLALSLWTTDGAGTNPMWEPYTDLTLNYRPNSIASDEIIVKSYSENEHLRIPLLAQGFFEDTGKRIESDFVPFEVWRLTAKFVAEFNKVHPELQLA